METTAVGHSIKVKPVTGAIGAEISGVDLSQPLCENTIAALRGAFLEHLVIFFRNQQLTPAELVAFGRNFGELHVHPITQSMAGHEELIEVIKEADERVNWGDGWHTDLLALPKPPLGSILYAKDVPPFSGDTHFLNMYLSYETLSPLMRSLLDGLSVINEQEVAAYEARFKSMVNRKGASASTSLHPLVRTHPETGRKSLFLTRPERSRIKDLSPDESDMLLAFLDSHASNPDFSCRFHWEPGSIAFWDNRCTRHRVSADYFYDERGFEPHRRHMYRVTLAGDVPR